jgi:hypothetical protein
VLEDAVTHVTVQLVREIPVGEEDELKQALVAAGFAVSAKELPPVRGTELFDAVALMMIPLHAFLSAAGSKAGAEVWPLFKAGVMRILHRKTPGHEGAGRPLVVQDTVTGLKIVMDRDLPDEAYEALRELDLSVFHQGPIDWDRSHRRWRSLTDEVAVS